MTSKRDQLTTRRLQAAELRWAAIIAGLLMVLTCLPYLYGLGIREPGEYYSGLLANPDEHNVYLSYMRQARDGAFFLIDPFTSESQSGRVINVFFLALGVFSRVTQLSLPVVYHLARVVSGWLLLMAIYCLAAQVLATVSGRRIALVLAGLASGLGWLYPASGGQPHPIDYGPGLVMPEAITFLSLLLNPLFCFSVFLMVAALGLAAHAFVSGSVRSAVLAGLAGLVLGNIHTYDLIPVVAVLAVFLIVLLIGRRLTSGAAGLAVLIATLAAPSVLYQAWLIRSGEVTLLVKSRETPVVSPEPLFLALGLGLPLALALVGAARSARRGASDGARAAALWLVLGFALVYLPVPFQRKLAEGLHVPVCVLAVFALEPLWHRAKDRRALWIGALLVLLAIPSSVLFVNRTLQDLRSNNQAYIANLMPPLYLRADQHSALQWLSGKATPSDVLLCSSFLGSYAPSLAGCRVYIGHWAETLHFQNKLGELSRFLRADTPDASREAFCRREGIAYVLRDDSIYDQVYYLSPEGEAGPGFDPEGEDWLARVYQQDRVSLYRVE
ncbi:MAG: hypothetical protein JSV79_12055 [Armatimonadota bacterium]|nr:MAG: hypothetical protein JSV79_12055 [Armatimonadota bacterium]